jgi:hypothetical protein
MEMQARGGALRFNKFDEYISNWIHIKYDDTASTPYTNLPVGDKDAEDELKDVRQECFRGHGHGQGHEQNEDSRTRGLHTGSSGLLNVCFSVGGNGVAMAATFHRLFVVCRFKKSTHRKIVIISGWREGRDEATRKQEGEDQGHYLTRPPMPIPFFVGPWQPI